MLKERIEADLKSALKRGEALQVSVMRMFLAAIKYKAIEKKSKTGSSELSEEEVVSTLRSEVKKRKDSIQEFNKGGRQDLIDKETAELKILEVYLPAEMSDEALEAIVKKIIDNFGSEAGVKDFGKIMGLVMKETKGQVSGDRVSKTVNKCSN